MNLEYPSTLPTVLLACPISSHKDYVILEWAEHVKTLVKNYPGICKVLLVDNSKSQAHAKRVERLTGFHTDFVSTRLKNNYDAISDSRNYIRKCFLRWNFDYLFSLECDIFPPQDSILYLLSLQKEMVGFTYFLGAGHESPLMVQEYEDNGTDRECQNLSIEQSILFIDGTIKRVFSIGMGCLMIPRFVLASTKFRTDKKIKIHDDSFFAEDCKSKGFKIYCDTSVIPLHKNQPWNLLKGISL